MFWNVRLLLKPDALGEDMDVFEIILEYSMKRLETNIQD